MKKKRSTNFAVIGATLFFLLSSAVMPLSLVSAETDDAAKTEETVAEAQEEVKEETQEEVKEEAKEETQEEVNEETQGEVDEKTEDDPEKRSKDEPAEWTVMMYVCGADLESQGALATLNLKAVASTTPDPDVNLVIETGGSKEWHTDEVGMNVDPSKLERWSYTADGFEKVGETELVSMGERSTLLDFLTWTAENYPAKKYQLILWDHGGASLSGVVFDELFKDSSLQMYDISGALEDSGLHLEVFMTDACLMATLETAETVAPYADYFVACEEALPGEGTNYAAYMQFLYDYPECNGAMLGKRICSTTEQMYSDLDSRLDLGFLTISLIDLSKVAMVREAFDDFITEADQLLDDPGAFFDYCFATESREKYSYNAYSDIYDLAQRASGHGISPKTAARLENAVEDAVLYNVRGSNHVRSHGMSVFYKLNEDSYRLDHFSRVCADPVYLAFLDRLSFNWKAPEWVYETVERKPDVSYEDYRVNTSIGFNDELGVTLEIPASDNFIVRGAWELLQYDPDSELWQVFGRDPFLEDGSDEKTIRWGITFDGTWPSLGGYPLTMSILEEHENYILFSAPMNADNRVDDFRIQYRWDTAEGVDPHYQLIGPCFFDDQTGYPDRNVQPVLSGTYIAPMGTLLDMNQKSRVNYRMTDPFVYYDTMRISNTMLPVGEYAVRFVVTDIFGNETTTEMVHCEWDGNEVTYQWDDTEEETAETNEESE